MLRKNINSNHVQAKKTQFIVPSVYNEFDPKLSEVAVRILS